jgi:predicted transcriptional regulator
MTKHKMEIGVGDEKRTAAEFINVWKRAESGDTIDAAYRLNFESLEALLRALTPSRWALLKTLRQSGPCSIRALSKQLGKDYKTVHTNVKMLVTMGLIMETEDGKVMVPWDIVTARLNLAA